jgi:hypothetical protein
MIPTLRISDGCGGFYIINQADYDPAVHQLLHQVGHDRDKLKARTVVELRALAATLGIPGRSKLKTEDQLITAILEVGYEPNQLPD